MINFEKFHGAGNDFILIDDRDLSFPASDTTLISGMCDRHFGIGADGLMLLQVSLNHDFKMLYFNADGKVGSMCGNGGRCIARFAHKLGVIATTAAFEASDGLHQAVLLPNGDVSLEMMDVTGWEVLEEGALLMNTGSPHYVLAVEDVDALDVVAEGRTVRYNQRFAEKGVNVNFVAHKDGKIKIRTYERGVENETLACGTGVTAAAIAAHLWGWSKSPVNLDALGGNLSVSLSFADGGYNNIWKTGPVKFVFSGQYPL